ncbi:hypothetical protein ACFZDG_35565 [Kitasatospora xanthocidica]|uniref:hypothetical protein n=1 Tax=Kitasatospora xanthocidica TaxID=83382 RepID=UPI0036EF36DA
MFNEFDLRVTSAEVEAVVGQLSSEFAKLVLTVAVARAQHVARVREEKWERERQAAAEQLWGDRAAAEPLLRAPYDERWWEGLTAQDLGRSWQAAYEWGASDPQAAAALHHMRREIKERFGLTVPDELLPVQSLSRALALGDPAVQEVAHKGRQASQERGDASFLYVIRDPADQDRVISSGEVRGPSWEAPEVLAANTLQEWAAGAGRPPLGPDLTIELVANTGEPIGDRLPAATVSGDAVAGILADHVEHQRRLITGEASADPAQVLHALHAEISRINSYAQRRQAQLDALQNSGGDTDPDLPEGERQRQVDAAQHDVEWLRVHQARLAVQVQAEEAVQRGEEPDYVFRDVALRARLGQGWMASATPAEAAGVWSEVQGWPEAAGAAKVSAVNALTEDIFRHYGIELPEAADRTAAAAALSAVSEAGAGPGSEAARRRALELHGRAADDLGKAALVEAEAGRLKLDPVPDPRRIAALDTEAARLRASAQADTAAASAAETEAAEAGASLDVVGSAEATELHRSAWDEDPEWAALTTARPAAAAPSAPAAPAASAPGANGTREAGGVAMAAKAAAALNAVPVSAGKVAAKVAGLGEGARPEGAVRPGDRKSNTYPNGGNAPGRAAKRTPERGR